MIKRDKEIIDYVFSTECTKEFRIKYFENDFLAFCLYYYPAVFFHKPAPFQYEYCDDLQDWKSIFFIWFRECSKTTLLKYYYTWIFAYKKRHYLMHYNSDIKKAKSFLFSLTLLLQKNRRFTNDFWYLYHSPEWRKKTDITKKTIWEFMIWDSIKVEAMSLWTSPRWASFTAVIDGYMREFRVDFVSMDDIDNDKNVWNPEIIQEWVDFILWEVSWWTSSFCQKVFLWNIVGEDTRVTRLKKHYADSPDMKVYWLPIRIKWKITWDRFVSTDKEAEEKNKILIEEMKKDWEPIDESKLYISLQHKRRDQWSINFNQNFNLIAYKKWQRIIKDSDIKHYYTLPNNYVITFWVDPAFSLKTWTDGIWLTVTAQETYNDEIHKYVIEIREFMDEEKDENNFCAVTKDLYVMYNCKMIYIETNNGWSILARMLRKRWMAVTEITSDKDKITRLREYQGEFERWLIRFNPDESKVSKWIQQLKDFPNWLHDDMCFVWDTKITTLFWDKNIKDIKIWDYVLTPFWYKKVIDSKKTGRKKVIKAIFWDKFLIWTEDHKIIYKNKTFWLLKDFKYNTSVSILNFKNLLLWKIKKQLYLTELNINLCDEKENIIFLNQIQMNEEKMLNDYIHQFGNFITNKKYQKAILFIIKTMILLITILLILSWLKLVNMLVSIIKLGSKIKNIVKNNLNIFQKLENWQKSGIDLQNEKNGIKNILKILYEKLKNTNLFVNTVETNMKAKGFQQQAFVQENVIYNEEKLKKNVLIVELNSKLIVKKQQIVVKNAELYQEEDVYNITVESIHCYYANWILVWNCDSLVHSFIPYSSWLLRAI